MSANDRGEHVRTPEAFATLAQEYFKDVDGEVLNTTTRIPSSHWMMRMSSPVTTYVGEADSEAVDR